MLELFFRIIIVFFFVSIPLLLWNYGTLFLSEHSWNRFRFFAGIFSGATSVGTILLFEYLLGKGERELLMGIGLIFILLGGASWGVLRYGSPYIRGFLRQVLFLHVGLFLTILILSGILGAIFSLSPWFLASIGGISTFFLLASLEEGVKHISSVGLTSKDFRFSKKDFLLATFFISLGFVMMENSIYLISAWQENIASLFFLGIQRSIFALPLHIFAASICVIFWWKALSYKLFSWQYIGLFLGGYLFSTFIHALYNYAASESSWYFILPIISIASYMTFTYWLTEEKTRESPKEVVSR